MKITKMSADGIEGEVQMVIFNPNKFSFKVTDYDLDIYLGDIPVGKAKLQDKVKVHANKEDSYTFHIKGTLGPMLLASLPLLLSMKSQKSTRVQAKGYVKVSSWGISKKIDVDLDDMIKLMQ